MQTEVFPLKKTETTGRGLQSSAIANNDVAIISWQTPQKIPNCLGFGVYRTDLNSKLTTPLPAWVGFQGESNPEWKSKTTEEWPIQKFSWKDLTAEHGGFYQYSIVPMMGKPGDLAPLQEARTTTNPVQLSPNRGDISCYFNRGILSTQFLAHQLPPGPTGAPDYKKLVNRIDQPSDPLRQDLAGDFLQAIPSLLKRAAREGGQCYAALYELNDPELEQLLIGCPYIHLILSNTGTTDSENRPARQALHESNTNVQDRMLPAGHIGHNKFMVYVDNASKPQAVLTGSTNWTATGLCGQSNNSLIIESQEIAKFYLDYWSRLREQESAQPPEFRTENDQAHSADLDNGNTHVTLWFSPNTKHQSKPSSNPATPSDMGEVFSVMESAKDAILFLAFQPGTPSIVDKAAECQSKNPGLYIRGAVTDPKAVDQFETDLYHRSVGAEPDAKVVAASAVDDQVGFWEKELLKSSPGAHAIIHDKIVVVDPFSPNCAVVTGSHNLGFRASYSNDENLLILRGSRAVAESYASHVLDVYDHYRWRYLLDKTKNQAWTGLAVDDSWQDKYFDPANDAGKEFKFWFNSGGK